jgi:hypothetical protein
LLHGNIFLSVSKAAGAPLYFDGILMPARLTVKGFYLSCCGFAPAEI